MDGRPPRELSTHALERYRSRLAPWARREDVEQALELADVAHTRELPGIEPRHGDHYAVYGRAVFVLRPDHGVLWAVTVLVLGGEQRQTLGPRPSKRGPARRRRR